MKNAIILHGRPSKAEYYNPDRPSMSNSHWLPWLQSQLLKHDIAAVTPEVPFSFQPVWKEWVKEVERFEIGPETILVGHSCGGGFWVRYLSEHPKLKVGKVVLVAPWIDVERSDKDFFDFKIDPDFVKRTQSLIVFHSDNDKEEMQTSLKKLKAEIPNLDVRIFHDYGHFTIGTMKTPEFPELLEEIFK
ncbi:MAG TPA: alpha/beta hydrolase [Candidatus Saccharimonadales bacterium]|nr:alpha/beta hydrolase [Candidatus Saccharimonadales bacterium]